MTIFVDAVPSVVPAFCPRDRPARRRRIVLPIKGKVEFDSAAVGTLESGRRGRVGKSTSRKFAFFDIQLPVARKRTVGGQRGAGAGRKKNQGECKAFFS
jgi:hypothetical protein